MNLTRDSSKIIDINEIIVKYIKKFPFPKDVKKEIDFDNICYDDIEDQDLIIDQERMEYIPKSLVSNDSGMSPTISGEIQPLSNVVFSCEFRNQTSSTQENNLSTSRETKSTTHISISRAILKEGSFSLQLQAPTSIMQANTAFRKSLTIDMRREYNLEETMTWTAQSKIEVPPYKQITAELIISEAEQYFDFRIKTTLSGKLKIFLRNKKSGWRMSNPLVISDLALVFCGDGFVKNDDNSVSFICSGTCYSRYGVAQKLNLIESGI